MYRKYLLPLILSLFCLSLFTGCSKAGAEQYVEEELAAIKENGAEEFSQLLDAEITKNTENFTLEFPEELKEPYLAFLQEAFKTMEFEVQKAKETEKNTYSVNVSFSPVDFATTLKESDDAYASSLSSVDLASEVATLLKKDEEILQNEPKFGSETTAVITVTKKDEAFQVASEEWKAFLEQALKGYMQPYNIICELLDAHDFMQSYLDACFKGEVAQFAKHTDRTEEEALAWYESDVFDPPADLKSAYADRYVAASKTIMKQCQYTVGIPKKDDGLYSFTFNITYTPNLGFMKTMEDMKSRTFYSMDEVSKGFVETLEKYAATPAYGEQASMPISLNLTNMLDSASTDSEFQKLGSAILPTE